LEMRVGDIIGMMALAIIIVSSVLIVANFQSAVGTLKLTGIANTTAACSHRHNHNCSRRAYSAGAWSLRSCTIKA